MDLSNSVVIPRDDFIELQEMAWHQPPVSVKEQVKSVTQTSVVFVAFSLATTAAIWGWAKVMDWKEERALQRKMTLMDAETIHDSR